LGVKRWGKIVNKQVMGRELKVQPAGNGLWYNARFIIGIVFFTKVVSANETK
jgi:hypothetical protein